MNYDPTIHAAVSIEEIANQCRDAVTKISNPEIVADHEIKLPKVTINSITNQWQIIDM